MVKYISDGTWFDRGTECYLVDDCSSRDVKMGIFRGWRTCEHSASEAGKPVGTRYLDEELCNFDEFTVLDRAFLSKPLRPISIEHNSTKITLEEFFDELTMGAKGYKQNMEHLKKSNPAYFAHESHYMEDWMESFLAWFELEQETSDDKALKKAEARIEELEERIAEIESLDDLSEDQDYLNELHVILGDYRQRNKENMERIQQLESLLQPVDKSSLKPKE